MSSAIRVRAVIVAAFMLALIVVLLLAHTWRAHGRGSAGGEIQGLGSNAEVLGNKASSANGSPSNNGNGQGNGNQGNNGNGNGNGQNPTPSPQATPPSKVFKISGSVTGLAPGVTQQLELKITNDLNQDLRVTSLSAKATAPEAGACTIDDVEIGSWTGEQFTVTRNSTVDATGSIPVKLRLDADNACQNVTFTLAYSGTAVQG